MGHAKQTGVEAPDMANLYETGKVTKDANYRYSRWWHIPLQIRSDQIGWDWKIAQKTCDLISSAGFGEESFAVRPRKLPYKPVIGELESRSKHGSCDL
jgi:hypothetical protein